MKLLKLNNEDPRLLEIMQSQFMEAFNKEFNNSTVCSTKWNLSINLADLIPKDPEEPVIRIMPLALQKMRLLIDGSDKELAGHGFVKAYTENGQRYFDITDITMYPQQVTSTTVIDSDDYHQWLNTLSNEELNSMRFQFHSHVNMGTSPSGRDDATMAQFIAPVRDYYIFMIMNKRNDYNIMLYDIVTNLIYETKDLDVRLMLTDTMDEDQFFVLETEKYLQKEPPKETYHYTANGGVTYSHRNIPDPTPPKRKVGRPVGSTKKVDKSIVTYPGFYGSQFQEAMDDPNFDFDSYIYGNHTRFKGGD